MRNFFLLKSVSSIVPIRIFSLKICGIIITLSDDGRSTFRNVAS